MEVEAWPQTVHLQKHLSQEQSEEQELCIICYNNSGFSFNTRGTDVSLFPSRLTEETGQPRGLVVMNDGHAQRVESHQAQNRPVKRLRLHHTADRDPQETLLAAEIYRWTSLGTPDACSCRGDAFGY